MTFANSEYILYVVIASAVTALVFAMYTWYRGKVVTTWFGRIINTGEFIRRYIVSMILCVLTLVLFSLLILRPQWGFTLKKERARGVDLVIALDVSRSMNTEDVGGSRLARAKNAVRYLAESVPGRLGLILFAGDAFIQCPLTTDRSAFMMYLDYASPESIALQGTDLGRALEEAGRLFEKQNPNRKVLLMITDGEDHEKRIQSVLGDLKSRDITVHTASVGLEKGGRVPVTDDEGSGLFLKSSDGKIVKSAADTDVLKKIARDTGGVHVSINGSAGHIRGVLSKIVSGKKSDFGSHYIREGKDRFQLFALACIVLLVGDMLLQIGWRK